MAGIFQSQGVWSCGFDFLPNGALAAGGVFDQALGANNVNASFARFSGKGIQFLGNNLYLGRSLNTNLVSGIVGFGFLAAVLPGASPNAICTFYDVTAAGQQVTLAYNTSGQLGFYSVGGFPANTTPSSLRGSLSASGVIIPGAYNMVELLTTIDPATGVLQCRVNQNTVVNFTGNTRTTANSFFNRFYFGSVGNGGGGGTQYFDDLYMLDLTQASPLDTFLGNGRIQTDGPSGDSATGGLNAFTHTTPQGTDFGNCANIPANVAQYNADATPGDRMSFAFPSIVTSKVFFLNSWMSAEQDAAGPRTLETIFRSNNVDQVGAAVTLSGGTYVHSNQASVTDPNTAALWANGSVAAAGSCEIGVEVAS